MSVEEILVASGKRPALNFGLQQAGLATNDHGLVANRYLQTSVPHIAAAGDVVAHARGQRHAG